MYSLSIEDGDVFHRASADIRSTASLSVLADWPKVASDLLNPYGNADLFIERGIVFGNDAREWVSQGYFRIDTLNQEDAPNGPIQIEASDRMAAIIDARLPQPRQYTASSTIRAVIEDLVLEIYPTVTVTITGFNPDVAFGTDQICEQDRYAFLNDIAKANGCVMYFDHTGAFVMKPVPNYDTSPTVWDIAYGARGVLINVSRTLSRDDVFNAVVANGEQAGGAEPVQGIAYDLNPLSPTRWNGPFKQVPRFYSSSFLRTNTQAYNAARAMLARSTGVPYTVDFNIVPNPALEPLDLVGVSYSDQSGKERHVLDTLTVPLVASRPMTGSSRIQPKEIKS